MTAAPVPVITIDGPSGSGKGTISQLLAQRLGWHYLDSGALYRAVAMTARRAGVAPDDAPALAALAGTLSVEFVPRPGDVAGVRVDGEEAGEALRTEEVGRLASRIAALPALRQALLAKQRGFRRPPGLVTDGRDMGTAVFPDALFKVFLTASPEIRARRRVKQLNEKGFDANLARLTAEIRSRDAQDAGRAVSPLKPAADAYTLDTSTMTIAEVVEHLFHAAQGRLAHTRPS